MCYFIVLVLVVSCLPKMVKAQDAHQLLRKGDREYQQGGYGKAEEHYRKSLARSGSANGYFNLGNSVYRQERFPEAIGQYEQAIRKAPNATKKAEAYYNLGNAQFEAGNLDKSIEAYKNALRHNPSDLASKYNLALVQKKMRQQQPPPQQQLSPNGQQQPQEPQNQPQQESGKPQQSPKSGADQQPSPGQKLSREEAEALLRIVGQEEKKVQSKMQKEPGAAKRNKKDW